MSPVSSPTIRACGFASNPFAFCFLPSAFFWLSRCTFPSRRLDMESRAKLFGHPIHQMLIVFPLGLLATSLFFDVIGLTTDHPGLLQAAWYMIAAGVISWLGGELVDRLGVGVDDGAHLDAPSSLSHETTAVRETVRR